MPIFRRCDRQAPISSASSLTPTSAANFIALTARVRRICLYLGGMLTGVGDDGAHSDRVIER